MDQPAGLSAQASSTASTLLSQFDLPKHDAEDDLVDMSVGENAVLADEMAELCRDAVRSTLNAQHLTYPKSAVGDPELLKVLAAFFNAYFNPAHNVDSTHVAVAPGASACLDSMMHSICDPGDAVLVPGPYWNGFDFHLKIRARVQPINVALPTLEQNFSLALVDGLEHAYQQASQPVKAIILTNPHNPLGQCYTRELLQACVVFCQRHDIHFISDEVYALSTFSAIDSINTPFTSALSLDVAAIGGDPSRVHVIWSISKDFGCNGLRLGCVVSQSNRPLILHLGLLSGLQISSLSSLVTKALLTSPKLPHLLVLSSRRLRKLYETLASFLSANGIRYFPATAGLFVFVCLAPNATSWEDELEMIRHLKEAGVIVGPGRAYHTGEEQKGWARLTFALRESDLGRALEALEKGLKVVRR